MSSKTSRKPALQSAVRAARCCGLPVAEQAPVQVLEDTEKSAVYRLATDGGSPSTVILKRCSSYSAGIETLLYETVLPALSIPALRLLGSWRDGTSTWLALEDAGDVEPALDDDGCRAMLTDWVGALHRDGRDIPDDSSLPDRGPGHFHQRLSTARENLLGRLECDGLDEDDRSTVERALTGCELLAARWGDIEDICEPVPQTLVHGDVVEENLRVRRSSDTPMLVALDWEKAGLGCPAVDLVRVDPERYFTENHDWLGLSREDFDRFMVVGHIFRQLVHAWTEKSVGKIERGERRLTKCLGQAGWSTPS